MSWQGLFNAIAFSGARFLFSKLNHTGYEAEIKRHNKPLEKLAIAEDRIQQLREQLSDANAYINQTNKTLDELRSI